MVSFAKLHKIRQRIRKKYKNIGLENFLLSIGIIFSVLQKTNNPCEKHCGLDYYKNYSNQVQYGGYSLMVK